MEIPPRVRGRGKAQGIFLYPKGNTPACAGKRESSQIFDVDNGKYPRVCGEENVIRGFVNGISEIPPRVRGRASVYANSGTALRNTPACAGKR